jgi:hypothetical protein
VVGTGGWPRTRPTKRAIVEADRGTRSPIVTAADAERMWSDNTEAARRRWCRDA